MRLFSLNLTSISAVFLVLAALPAVATGPNGATAVPLGVSSTWSGDTINHSVSDNSGRQLAVAIPVAPSMNVKVPGSAGRLVKPAPKKGQVLKITVPASVDETADVCRVGLKRFSTVGQQKAKELCQWALAFHKQMTQTPVMTPLGGPYPTPTYAETKLYYTSEGRLKTVVKR
ncbi:MAG: hypothetical protein EKK48_03745 [Candidatus Melainabacteria bacterium]|nr:MAG: hypothetical protein EKK48_03745 [Candidatus Melainabacteria bacterium]